MRSIRKEVKITGTIKLSDLRWMIKECEGFSDDSLVTVKESHGDQLDYYPAEIVVHGE